MKKIIMFISVLLLVFGFNHTPLKASNRVTLDGAKVIENRTLVPLRSIFEELGASVEWNQKDKTVTATKGSTTVWLKLGSKNTKVNGQTVIIDVPAKSYNGSTYVPLRFVSEAMGANVNWDGGKATATITQSDKTIVVTVGNVNVDYATTTQYLELKNYPGTSYETVGFVGANSKVEVIGGEPIGLDQYNWISADTYGWSEIKYNGQKGWVPTHELVFVDPYNWVLGVKDKTLNEIKNKYVSSNDKIKLEKSKVYGSQGRYELLVQRDGTGEWVYVVTINCKTGWYHG